MHRNVGLAVETRPDEITPDELAWFRTLGVTKVQMGVQSLDDRILELNQRGHTVAEAHRAVALLRAGWIQNRPALDAQPAGRHARIRPG